MEKFDCNIFMASLRKMLNEPPPETPTMHSLLKLLNLEGEAFLQAAYRLIMGREADPAGMRGYASFANSRAGRLRVICALLVSPERGSAPIWLVRTLRRTARLARSFRRR